MLTDYVQECYDCVHGRIVDVEPQMEYNDKNSKLDDRKLLEAAKGKPDVAKSSTAGSTVGEGNASNNRDQARWVAQAMDGVGNLDIGGEEWSDDAVSVLSSLSGDSNFSI